MEARRALACSHGRSLSGSRKKGPRLELHDVRVAAALQHGDLVPEAAALLLTQVVQHLDGDKLHATALNTCAPGIKPLAQR